MRFYKVGTLPYGYSEKIGSHCWQDIVNALKIAGKPKQAPDDQCGDAGQ